MATKTPISRSAPRKSPGFRGTQGKDDSLSSKKMKAKHSLNGSILTFFKKSTTHEKTSVSEEALFIDYDLPQSPTSAVEGRLVCTTEYNTTAWAGEESSKAIDDDSETSSRFNESNGSVKRRKLSNASTDLTENGSDNEDKRHDYAKTLLPHSTINIKTEDQELTAGELHAYSSKTERAVGPFFDESDSEDDDLLNQGPDILLADSRGSGCKSSSVENGLSELQEVKQEIFQDRTIQPTDAVVPLLKREGTSYAEQDGFEGFEDLEDFDDEYAGGEEYVERRWMQEQRRLELEEGGLEEDFKEENNNIYNGKLKEEEDTDNANTAENTHLDGLRCPVCSVDCTGVSDQEASLHVNNCLDGNPTPLHVSRLPNIAKVKIEPEIETESRATLFSRPARPAKPGQANPFMLGTQTGAAGSAFSKMMSGHAEDEAWAVAAASEHAARGKPAYQRTCPFYKILPGFFTCVDAFRYGAVQGCKAYFLSHFHSDHYVGLTSTWSHGPIYCSHVTANLVRQQLRVDPKWVVDLEFEKKAEIPNTDGVFVTMIPANHCPGSSIYLFEKTVGQATSKAPRVQRVLHCGDFRACPAHVEHPLLRPEVVDLVSGKTAQQKIDVCYLDTTYLNPKYAFPSQEDVIQACADMCVSMNKAKPAMDDSWERVKKERAGGSMTKFIRTESKDEAADEGRTSPEDSRGRLLVIVGTYSIGKERICLGIAKALNSKIYAPASKQRICACLEDPQLNARLTNDPREAQVHMTPLFEIRPETLGEYLADYSDRFSRCVGFRPSGWTYRPPGSRFTESPAVGTVLYSDNWKSEYSMRDLMPQRGSSNKASCFGVPYSEHSSFRELTMFCCALRIEKIIPTVNVGSAKSREKMKMWCERWAVDRKKNGLFKTVDDKGKGLWYSGRGTMELRTNL